MRQTLELRASQQLALTPQIVQAIRLLQLSAADLEHEVEEALANNPFLERLEPAPVATANGTAHGAAEVEVDTVASAEAVADNQVTANPPADEPAGADADDSPDSYDPWVGNPRKQADNDRQVGDFCAAATTLRDHLTEQLAGARLSETDRFLVETVIDALDDDGYLRQSTADLLATVPPEVQAGADELEVAIRYVQSFDPAGVGARSLAECLALQLERSPEETDGRDVALVIVREHLDLLALHDSARLAQELGCDDEAIRRANVLIRRLNPRPGTQFGDMQARYVVADVVVRKIGGKWIAAINPQAVPNIQINRVYAEALQRSRDGQCAQLAQHLQEARWLIRNVQQRFDTIQRVAQVIVDRQRLFFELGEMAMRPLVLRDVARELGLHPSTVSRVTSNKYVQTPSGLIELKRFFSSRVSTREDGASCSSTAIRALIRELVAAENPQDPLSDVQITRLLASRGITVARRTVAKYRTSLRIPSVESRRMAIDGAVPRRPSPPRPIAALASERRRAAQQREVAAHAAAE
ncbi:MAG TPA: RNA polymerase factor sigma-54 [Burkholderiaceae bacterium]|nr:RNA polymerase factor sigma-54 [Burkholderiaceae bacterium]